MSTYQITTALGHVTDNVTLEKVEYCLLDAIIEKNDPIMKRLNEIKSGIIQLMSDDDLDTVYTDSQITIRREDV